MNLLAAAFLGIMGAAPVADALTITGMTGKPLNIRQQAVDEDEDTQPEDEDPGQWAPDLRGTIGGYLRDGGVVVGTTGLYIAGQPAMFVFIQRGDNLYRCVDLYTEAFRPTAYVCYGLKTNTPDQKPAKAR
jgi:hypothetical protein